MTSSTFGALENLILEVCLVNFWAVSGCIYLEAVSRIFWEDSNVTLVAYGAFFWVIVVLLAIRYLSRQAVSINSFIEPIITSAAILCVLKIILLINTTVLNGLLLTFVFDCYMSTLTLGTKGITNGYFTIGEVSVCKALRLKRVYNESSSTFLTFEYIIWEKIRSTVRDILCAAWVLIERNIDTSNADLSVYFSE